MKIALIELREITYKAIKTFGYTDDEANVIQDILLFAQLRGNNQGIVKLIGDGIPRREGVSKPSIVKETPVSVLLSGNNTHAMLVMNEATELAIQKAKSTGIGIGGNFNSTESTGALGYYVEKIAREGLIGMAFASAPFQTTAIYGSNEARLCTNPLAYGIPTKDDPIVLDMSTSSMAYYGLIEAKTAGLDISDEIGFDSSGNKTTDPAEVMSGALKAFGGHKGSGLALVVQVLAGAFVGADSFDNESDNAGNLVIAIDPEIFHDLEKFKLEVTSIVQRLKSSRKLDGVEDIMMPGERGNSFRAAVEASNEIEVEDNLWEAVKALVE